MVKTKNEVSLSKGLLESVTHYSFNNAVGIHGIVIDPKDGSIWACDLDKQVVSRYSAPPSISQKREIPVGLQPVGGALKARKLYIVDRLMDAIFVLDKKTLKIIDAISNRRD